MHAKYQAVPWDSAVARAVWPSKITLDSHKHEIEIHQLYNILCGRHQDYIQENAQFKFQANLLRIDGEITVWNCHAKWKWKPIWKGHVKNITNSRCILKESLGTIVTKTNKMNLCVHQSHGNMIEERDKAKSYVWLPPIGADEWLEVTDWC